MTLGAQGAGETAFQWDGRDASGVLRAPGNYRVVAQGLRDGEPVGLTTSMSAPVDSVSTISPADHAPQLPDVR